ncbi:unnamed protein product [Closterium sp. Yama58-4]|nr:unnamed protein product [Closterium sp. Yama58-4]
MYAEGRNIVVLLDNASSHTFKTEGATTEDIFGFRTCSIGNVRLVYSPPNTTCFTQPLDLGLIPMAKARYCQHWLRAFTRMRSADGATFAAARFKPNLRDMLDWLSDACSNDGNGGTGSNATDIGLDEEVDGVGLLIDRLCLGSSAMAADAFVGIDDHQPTCAEPGEEPLVREPAMAASGEMREAPANMQDVYDDCNPASREAGRTARAAFKMMIGYTRATCITPRDLCTLFDIRNPIINVRMERASSPLDLNSTPPPVMTHADTPLPETPRRHGRVLPA